MKLICLGDSLTYGLGVRRDAVWTALLGRSTGWHVVNRGVSGDTTGGMLVRLRPDVISELATSPAGTQVLVMGGSNDIFASGTDCCARGNLSAIIHQLFGIGVVPLVGIPLPVDPPVTPPAWRGAVDFRQAAETLEGYITWMHHYCQCFDVPVVDFGSQFRDESGAPRREWMLDGLHPNELGHRQMAALLEELLRRRI